MKEQSLSKPVSGPQKKLLLISCSATKKNLINKPALQVYDGPSYKILRKYNPPNLDILILSAKYGLIDADQKISTYEQKMTESIAKHMQAYTTVKLTEILNTNEYNEIHVNLGKTYIMAIDFENPMFKDFNIYFNNGPIGVRLHNLKTWLNSLAVLFGI